MSKSAANDNLEVIDSPDCEPQWEKWGAEVRKIVLGPSPETGGEKKTLSLDKLPENLAQRFPALTHLHLWNIEGLRKLPLLPAKLESLDLRGCADLPALPALPATLATLVLDGCASLECLPEGAQASLGNLADLSLKRCAKVPQAWIHRALAAAPGLRFLDASGCPQLLYVTDWPPALERIELNECESLRELPGQWPEKLRRVGLRGAVSVAALPDSTDTLDYLDLAHMASLRHLPAELGRPRTLFLHGSGVVRPPASEHGKDAHENVALRTRAYFEDVALVGKGRVKRCKILMLGNGGAGKTCLSLALVPGNDPADADKLGSTHGVQFWDWPFRAKVENAFQDVHLHLWDFGGQEIYHNTHRLFMGKGTVFVVLWKPAQDGKQPQASDCGYQDDWRPLQYWIDFIHLTCPRNPRIAIVCSHHAAPSDELQQRWRSFVSPEFQAACPLFFIDSLHRAGELERLEDWLRQVVGEVVESQGVEVPSYWEIAQDMVQGWIRRMEQDPAFAATHNNLDPDRFRESLDAAMKASIAGVQSKQYAPLKKKLDSGAFQLTRTRVERTLAFLTHSGWVYWDKNLFQGRVVVGQKWALDGIYAVLERHNDSPVFRALTGSHGRFTLSQLGEWSWNAKGYAQEEQALLRSFMEQCRLCFKLRSGPEACREEDVFVSFEHLPNAKELDLRRTFDDRLPRLNANIRATKIVLPGLHKLHWQAFLTDAGAHYGKDARYALDGFYVENEDGQKVLVLCHLDDRGLGGEIEIRVGGPGAEERLKAALGHVGKFLPGPGEGAHSDPGQALGKRAEIKEVFISYTWNPPAREGGSGIPPGYEQPVDAIEAFLKDKPVILIRDKNVAKFGDDLKRFMEYGASRPYVIVVHSDKYWKSPCCIFELWTVNQELRTHKDRELKSTIIPVEHLNSAITVRKGLEEYLIFWNGFTETPALLDWPNEKMKDHARSLLRYISEDLSGRLGLNLRWKDGQDKVLSAIAERLALFP